MGEMVLRSVLSGLPWLCDFGYWLRQRETARTWTWSNGLGLSPTAPARLLGLPVHLVTQPLVGAFQVRCDIPCLRVWL